MLRKPGNQKSRKTGNSGGWYFLLSCFSAFLLFVPTACGPKSKSRIVPPPPISYADLAALHNRRVDAITDIWTRAVVEIRWTDEKGKRHFEQGDGPLIVRKPAELALAVGKLGDTKFWLGCDAERYWLFDLSGDERLAYIGRQSMMRRTDGRILPLPVRADRLLDLLDITPLPPQANLSIDGEHYKITLPADSSLGGLSKTLWLDQRGRAVRIALADADDRIVIDAGLSEFERVTLAGKPPGAFPQMAGRVEITLIDEQATVTLFMPEISDGEGKIRDVQFDFNDLTDELRIERVIDVDQQARP